MLSRHIDEPELMDNPAVPYADLETALDELGQINRWLGGYRTTRAGIQRLLETLPDHRSVSVLDVAAGGTDLAAVLDPLGRKFEVTSLDINPLMGEYARRHGHNAANVVGSALSLQYPDRSFDIVHISLFLHHCTDDAIINLLRNAARIASIGVVVNDLERNVLALSGISLLTSLFSRSPIVRNDAKVSVRRAFTRRELDSLVSRAHVGVSLISRHWAFRWCVSFRANGHG